MSTANATISSTGQVDVTFHLHLPKSLSSCTQDCGDPDADASDCLRQWRPLPSSLSVHSISGADQYSSVQKFDAMVSYMMQAHVFRNGEMIGSASRDLRLFDAMSPQPPTCLSDFPSEYLCEQRDALRRRILTRRVGVFSAAVTEPAPFSFYDGQEFVMTRLPISFAVQVPLSNPPDRTSDALNPNITITTPFIANITWQLKTLTFMSAEPMDFVPTVLQAHRTPSITAITTLGLRHRLKLALGGWKKGTSSSAKKGSSDKASCCWTIDEDLALSIPTRCLLAPTFVTPHLSRRYSLTVQVKVAGFARASVRLEVPVQIVYQTKKLIGTAGIYDDDDDGSRGGGGGGDLLGRRDQSGQLLRTTAVAALPVYVP